MALPKILAILIVAVMVGVAMARPGHLGGYGGYGYGYGYGYPYHGFGYGYGGYPYYGGLGYGGLYGHYF